MCSRLLLLLLQLLLFDAALEGSRSEPNVAECIHAASLLLHLLRRLLLLLRLVLLPKEIMSRNQSTGSLELLDHLSEHVLHGAEVGRGMPRAEQSAQRGERKLEK